MKLDAAFLDSFAALGNAEPPSKKLSLLTRPAFVARPGRTLVWGDWSNIEARVLPWLASSKGAEAKLEIFRAIDRNPKLPDVYMRTASEMLGKPVEEVSKAERQSHGKVPELSLGFGGGVGALMRMATNYGVYLEPDVAKRTVEQWREANQWARDFWGYHGRDGSAGLWGAVCSAMEQPETIFVAGRIAYVCDPSYLGGTLFCALPDQTLLTYPAVRWEWREVEDPKTRVKEDRYQLTFLKGYGRSALWYGKMAENVTQAVAARVLRRCLRRLDTEDREDWMPVVMHTHDEIVTEALVEAENAAASALFSEMELVEPWAEGLPLKAEITTNWYYTKRELKKG
jgi:DNA polymerase